MKKKPAVPLISMPVYEESLRAYGSFSKIAEFCRAHNCAGIEAVWGGDDAVDAMPAGLALGYHLIFYPDWVDFWRQDKKALCRKFGSVENARAFYHADGPDGLLAQYRNDLARAKRAGARYVVFHVSDVSIEEGYTYRWEHTDTEVLDCAAELINALLGAEKQPFAVLLENQWWPGLTFTDPEKTAYLLDRVQCPDKGLLLDTGHLMNCNTALGSEREGAAYLMEMLDRHGALVDCIHGIHLHQSLSGSYVQQNTGFLPSDLPEDYVQRFGVSYAHILKIDRHQPWTDPAIAEVLERIAPEYISNELSAADCRALSRAVSVQMETLRKGGHY